MYGNIKQCLNCNARVRKIYLIIPHAPKNDHIIFNFDNVLTMSHDKTKMAVSCLHKNRLYLSTVSKNMCISQRSGEAYSTISLHPLSPPVVVYLPPLSLSLSPHMTLSLSLSLSLSCLAFSETVLYLPFKLNIHVIVKKSIDTSLMICIFYSIF